MKFERTLIVLNIIFFSGLILASFLMSYWHSEAVRLQGQVNELCAMSNSQTDLTNKMTDLLNKYVFTTEPLEYQVGLNCSNWK